MITVYGANTRKEDLANVQLQRPEKAGKYWQGIHHSRLTTTLANEISNRGWEITGSKFSLSKDEADLAGAFSLKIENIKTPEGMDLSLGFLTSNAMRKSLTMVVGANVQVCNNGMATGEIVMKKKHTSGFSLVDEIRQSLDQYEIKAGLIGETVKSLRQCEISETQSDEILMAAGRLNLMPWSRIGAVDKEYRKPTFAEHGRGTSWALLNAFTYTVKRNPALKQMEQMNQFRGLLPTYTEPSYVSVN
tara:strand:+ start:241 stop:981 length:741 start_codon:yes stop_codon:yes gene_type:complete